MSITVKNLFADAGISYRARLLAGEKGLGNLVDWFNAVEDSNTIRFLRGQEVVFTTGLLITSDDYFLTFTKNLHKAKVSALVVYSGPHIQKVPDSVISFCNRVSFPLYIIPWEVYLIDITRDFGEKIIFSNKQTEKESSLVMDLIFGTGNPADLIHQFERLGFHEGNPWTFLGITLGEDESGGKNYSEKERLVIHAGEYQARKMHDLFVCFRYRKKIFFLLPGYTDAEIRTYADLLLQALSRFDFEKDLQIGVGENIAGIENQRKNFEHAYKLSCLARRRKEKILFYSDLDIEKLLLGIADKELLTRYYSDTLQPLQEYDRTAHTDLCHFLEVYLACDGSPQAVSEKLFIHRNTVGKYVKKIEEIVKIPEMTLEVKARFLLAFSIKDFLDL